MSKSVDTTFHKTVAARQNEVADRHQQVEDFLSGLDDDTRALVEDLTACAFTRGVMFSGRLHDLPIPSDADRTRMSVDAAYATGVIPAFE